MKVKLFVSLVVFIIAALLLTSCSKAPQELVEAAKNAVDSAKSAQADLYVPDEFQNIQDSLNAALSEIQAQDSKFFISRDYTHAKKLLESTTSMAETVIEDANFRKDEIRVEVQESLAELKLLLEENKNLMSKAPKGKDGRQALEIIEDEITVIEASLSEVSALITNGDYINAKDKIDAGLVEVQSINDELREAIAKRSGISKKATRS
ncbi:MAG: DUF4398 domain-containing protein [bacterium]|nr:MAG: DUF4398 domain-containing protein [bacterium]